MFRPSANGSATKRVRTTTTVTKAKPKAKPKPRVPRQLALLNIGKGFPVKLKMTHRYTDFVRVLSSAGASAFQKYAANGLYDPDISGGGHQPYYFDQLSAIYNHWTVTSSTITVTCVPATSGTTSMLVTLAENDDSTASNTSPLYKQVEITGAKYCTLPQGAGESQVMRHSYDAEKVFGGDPLSNDNLQGSITQNPNELYCWIIGMQPFDLGTSCGVDLLVDIQFTCVWDELKEVPTS